MSELDRITEAYVKEVRKSKTYQKYKERLNALKKDEELYKKVEEYRTKRYEMQKNTPAHELYDKADYLEREYAYLYDNQLSARFLESEVALCRMIQDICFKIAQSIDFDLF